MIMDALSVAWSFGVQLVIFFCSGISVVLFDTLRDLQVSRGWSGGAMVLGKLPVPGRPTYLEL